MSPAGTMGKGRECGGACTVRARARGPGAEGGRSAGSNGTTGPLLGRAPPVDLSGGQAGGRVGARGRPRGAAERQAPLRGGESGQACPTAPSPGRGRGDKVAGGGSQGLPRPRRPLYSAPRPGLARPPEGGEPRAGDPGPGRRGSTTRGQRRRT